MAPSTVTRLHRFERAAASRRALSNRAGTVPGPQRVEEKLYWDWRRRHLDHTGAVALVTDEQHFARGPVARVERCRRIPWELLTVEMTVAFNSRAGEGLQMRGESDGLRRLGLRRHGPAHQHDMVDAPLIWTAEHEIAAVHMAGPDLVISDEEAVAKRRRGWLLKQLAAVEAYV